MSRRVIAFVSAVGVSAALLSGCGGSEGSASDDTLTIALNEPIDSWNPQQALNTTSYTVFPQIFGSLLTTPADGEAAGVEPGLATSYEFDDRASTITFELDPDARFSDGGKVTAADVVYSEDLWAAGEIYGSYFDSIQRVRAQGDHTVVFELDRPDHALLGILASANAAVVPDDLGGMTPERFWKRPISTGAYAIEDETVGQTIILARNPHYQGSPDRPEKIEYSVVSDAAQQQLQFQSGQVDVVADVQLDVSSQYPSESLHRSPSSRVTVLMLNTKLAPLDEVGLRRAIALAIDHEALVSGGFAGLAQQATGLLPQIIPGVATCDGCDWGRTDVQEAQRLVDESGYDGKPLDLLLASGPGPEKLAAEAIVPMLAKVGITVNLKSLPLSAYLDKLESGDYELGALSYNALAASPVDPLGFLASTQMMFSYADPAAARRALREVTSATTTRQMDKVTSRFETWAYESAPVIPLAVPDMLDAVSDRVEGFPVNSYQAWRVADVTLTD